MALSAPETLPITVEFRTLAEAQAGAQELSLYFPDPALAYFGLHELMINAIEHGNLGIGGRAKAALQNRTAWQEEVERRLKNPSYAGRTARATLTREHGIIRVTITDEGPGFDWEPYVNGSSLSRHAQGHGIRNAVKFSTLHVAYSGAGNTVTCSTAPR